MRIDEQITQRLTAAFAPTHLKVINESHRHAGHAGDDGSGESHFRVELKSASFAGQSRLARHRAVHAALGADIVGRIHALALQIDAD